jgi:hypothetical protein
MSQTGGLQQEQGTDTGRWRLFQKMLELDLQRHGMVYAHCHTYETHAPRRAPRAPRTLRRSNIMPNQFSSLKKMTMHFVQLITCITHPIRSIRQTTHDCDNAPSSRAPRASPGITNDMRQERSFVLGGVSGQTTSTWQHLRKQRQLRRGVPVLSGCVE